jgi:hypothetical protein
MVGAALAALGRVVLDQHVLLAHSLIVAVARLVVMVVDIPKKFDLNF